MCKGRKKESKGVKGKAMSDQCLSLKTINIESRKAKDVIIFDIIIIIIVHLFFFLIFLLK